MDHTLTVVGDLTPRNPETVTDEMKEKFFQLVEEYKLADIFPANSWQGENLEIRNVETGSGTHSYQRFLNTLKHFLQDEGIQNLILLGTFLIIVDNDKAAELLRVTVEGTRIYVQGAESSTQWKQKHKM